MDPHSLKKLNALRRERQAAILLTDLGDGRDRVIGEGDTVAGALGDAVARAFRSGKSGVAEIDGRDFFLNVHLPAPRLVVIGAVHISQALAPMAKIAGFDLTIIDPRTAFASPERFPEMALHAEWPDEALARQPLDAYTALAALTHDPKIDDPALRAAFEAECFYIGALGSRKTHATRVERLIDAGVPGEALERIDAPIGLDIGAATPAEIAVAVLGAVIRALRTRGLQGGSVPA
ncbi:predicted sulfurylase large subunit, molybdopterin cytosine dinucleotide biosynthesis [Nitratireductor aquibiodomus]|uniref:Predicted sulfurylase large subunit, molybdopterin cytosine dinucleotide biosynthesis n=1 Tax=Nitratireductor aquibiodomus TaxID=204799 RepID=A0A1H4IMQ6_9HYPH|nr:XdhC family protein [Nitratireductor aquibiodomus]SEB34956.1 predicted sulfurylase large subunit, molybdopterin cytosine dinucleotide biosynthesis [Nitratireductor aquibiodomus]